MQGFGESGFAADGPSRALVWRAFGDPADVLHLEAVEPPPLAPGRVRVRMVFAAINPSDLIPITGAYRHRVRPPRVGGYEGVGVVTDAPEAPTRVGRRVLPLRGPGTWQTFVDCEPQWLVDVPDTTPSPLAARGYINPLSARLMLEANPVARRRIVLTAAASSCGLLLAHGALKAGAAAVTGIVRTATSKEVLASLGVTPIAASATDAIIAAAAQADIVFDAVGGDLAQRVLDHLRPGAAFVSYGLLSGVAPKVTDRAAYSLFQLRQVIETMSRERWTQAFEALWPWLHEAPLPPPVIFSLAEWRQALAHARASGHSTKALLRLGPDV